MRISLFSSLAITIAILLVACENGTAISPTDTQESKVIVQPTATSTAVALAQTPTQATPLITPTPLQITIEQPIQSRPTTGPTDASSSSPVTPVSPALTPTPVRVGAGLPDFTLPVATGGQITLSDYVGKKNVVLVFYRAWWCLYCRDQLIELRNHHREIMAQDAVVLAISTDNLEGAKYAVETFAAPFAILYDVTTQVPKQYNVFNLHGDNLASASIFIIDKTGQLRFKEIGEVYTHQVSSAKIVSEIKKFRQ